MKYSTETVLKVNEVFHDVEKGAYDDRHPEIFIDEVSRWEKTGSEILVDRQGKLTVLDIGSGSGFVPLRLAQFLKPGDKFICSDLSANILNVCKEKLLGQGFKCDFDYIKVDGKGIPLPADSCDLITMNSVLHHIPDFRGFLGEINRLLKPGGLLIIGHEPNKVFYNHRFLRINFRVFNTLFNPKKLIIAITKPIGLYKPAKKIFSRTNATAREHSNTIKEVNRRLIAEGVFDRELSAGEITEIVDIQSPTAGGFHRDRGIDVNELIRDFLPGYQIKHLETYNYIFNGVVKNRLVRWYDNCLCRKYPDKGATIFAVMEKNK